MEARRYYLKKFRWPIVCFLRGSMYSVRNSLRIKSRARSVNAKKTLFVVRVFHDGRSIELCFFGIRWRNNDSNKNVMGFAEAQDPRTNLSDAHTSATRTTRISAAHTNYDSFF